MKRAPDHLRACTCLHCGALFADKPSRKRSYCSRACLAEARRSRPRNDPRPCKICGTIFTPVRGRGAATHCSKRCIWQSTKGANFNARIARETAIARAEAQRDRGEGKAYRKLDGRHEHRVIAERKLGRPLRDGEVVHHIDGNIRNNTPENLEIISQAEHMRRHGLGIPGMKLHWKPWESRYGRAKT